VEGLRDRIQDFLMAGTIFHFIRPRAVYEAGFSGSVSVPDGVSCFQAWVQAAGGAGQTFPPQTGGGGGGGFVYFYSDVLEAEWGTSITLAVGAAAAGASGGNSTVTGTLNGSAFSLTANGGSNSGTGGTASGGATNISGTNGSALDPEEDTDAEAGIAGGDEQDLVEYGGNGGLSSAMAADGYIAIEWG